MNKLFFKLKVKLSLLKVLNRSRYYKIFDSILEELNRFEKFEEFFVILKKKNILLDRERE